MGKRRLQDGVRLRVEQKVDADVRDERKIEDEKVRREEKKDAEKKLLGLREVEWKGQITRMIIEGFGVVRGGVDLK